MKPLFCKLMLLALLPMGAAVQAQEAKGGDVVAGRNKAAMCIGCHGIKGYQASFPEVHKVPMISGQNAKYIASALGAYRKGDRKHPTMRAVAGSLTDQDIGDLAAFYEQDGGKAESAAAAPAPERRRGGVAEEGRLHHLPRREPQQAHRPQLPQAGGPVRRLPLRGAQGLQDREEPERGPGPSGDGGAGAAVQACGTQGAGQLHGDPLPSELKTVPQSRFK